MSDTKFLIFNNRGVSLYLALIIMALLLAIALGINTILLAQLKMVRGMGDSVIALFAADTGIERVLYAIKQNDFHPNYSGLIGEARFDATLVCGKNYNQCPAPLVKDPNCSASYFCLKSIGSYKKTKRAIETTR